MMDLALLIINTGATISLLTTLLVTSTKVPWITVLNIYNISANDVDEIFLNAGPKISTPKPLDYSAM